jgi:hypothetical protein
MSSTDYRLTKLELKYLQRPELIVDVTPDEDVVEHVDDALRFAPKHRLKYRVKVLYLTTRRGDEIFTAGENFLVDGAFFGK